MLKLAKCGQKLEEILEVDNLDYAVLTGRCGLSRGSYELERGLRGS